ncbi:MAG: M48 family metallopeptidase [Ignavibacteriales bacterium]|nr:M48 family metallopeptidase [Ignavibacteriales bacterium]MCB9219102.1 M48 family metallopeptidase [Ignavibacteriales bacterium]MCB9259684.1 M48 family metallopeptidase [Ignavibacteriales bacterium]
MKRKLLLITFLVAAIFSNSCSTVPVTGRKQLSIIPASQLMSLSFQEYDQFMKENKLSKDAKQTAMIKNVGAKIQKSVEQYLAQKNLSDHLNGYSWEFNLVESDQVNAWCMPGGKVVFYTGIVPICKDEAGIATVMGHEIAHAIAEHGGERMSQGLIVQLGGMGLQAALESEPALTQQLAMTAFGIGSQVGVMLPFSRLHESEADHMGLIFMAMAGYNPNEAVEFWKRMAAQGGGAPPEFLSTHPSNETRINDLKKLVPEAMQYYKK